MREKNVMDYLGSQCDYCGSSIVSGQRWVREKIFDPALNSRDAHYHWYHAEPFEGQEGSCWAKHEMEREIARTYAIAAKRGHSEILNSTHSSQVVSASIFNAVSASVSAISS